MDNRLGLQEFKVFIQCRIRECMRSCMSKPETERHLWEQYEITYARTNKAWEDLQREDPDFFRSYENNRRNRDGNAPNVTAQAQVSEVTGSSWKPGTLAAGSAMGIWRSVPSRDMVPKAREQEQQPLIPPTAPGSSKALQNQYPTAECWQKLFSTLDQIQSNTVKLLTRAPNPTAAGSSKRQRVEQAKERGDNEEAENLQEKERGDNDEADILPDLNLHPPQ